MKIKWWLSTNKKAKSKKSHSESNLKSVMINIFIYIESMKFVQCISERKGSGHQSILIYRKKICCTNDGIKMNYSSKGFAFISVQFKSPHPCPFICQFSHTWEPMYKSTWILCAIVSERRKKVNTSNIETTHSRSIWICLYEDAVIPSWTFYPSQVSTAWIRL